MNLPLEITNHPDFVEGRAINTLKILNDNFESVEIVVHTYFNGWEIYKNNRRIRYFFLDVKNF